MKRLALIAVVPLRHRVAAWNRRRRDPVLRRLERRPGRRRDRRLLQGREHDRRRVRGRDHALDHAPRYDVSRLDMDVEGRSLNRTAGIDRWNKALKLVEDWAAGQRRPFEVSYTVPGLDDYRRKPRRPPSRTRSRSTTTRRQTASTRSPSGRSSATTAGVRGAPARTAARASCRTRETSATCSSRSRRSPTRALTTGSKLP